MTSWLYPRLGESEARRLIAEHAGLSLDALEDSGGHTHPAASPSATGGQPVPVDVIQRVQEEIRRVAQAAGYPQPLGGNAQRFDRPVGSSLFRTMSIVPADAADDGVWSFLTLVVVPEIGPWRFPERAEERLLGRPRNVLRRTYWRAWAIGPELDEAPPGCTPLGEDESVQIMERPSLGGNRRTASALRDAIWRAELDGLSVARSELVRQMARRLRAARSHTSLDALSETQLCDLLDHVREESLTALQG